MRKLSQEDIERLDHLLCGLESDDAMLLSTLDGYLSGVVVAPQLIRPSEWYPVIWGSDAPAFANEQDAKEIFGLIGARYNEIAHGLMRKGKHEPILDQDTDGEILWETWAEGFGHAMGHDFDSWLIYDNSPDEDVRVSFRCLASLVSRALDHEKLEELVDQKIRSNARQLITNCLASLNAARLAIYEQSAPEISLKPGRNDPCPCGSGHKFKKCCLN